MIDHQHIYNIYAGLNYVSLYHNIRDLLYKYFSSRWNGNIHNHLFVRYINLGPSCLKEGYDGEVFYNASDFQSCIIWSMVLRWWHLVFFRITIMITQVFAQDAHEGLFELSKRVRESNDWNHKILIRSVAFFVFFMYRSTSGVLTHTQCTNIGTMESAFQSKYGGLRLKPQPPRNEPLSLPFQVCCFRRVNCSGR